jgi:hypothetical protein
MATSAWLWLFWRIKVDGNHLLVRWRSGPSTEDPV